MVHPLEVPKLFSKQISKPKVRNSTVVARRFES